jgi:hypothetical protein
MFGEAVELGYQPPTDLREWGSIGEYHLEETWPGKIPPNVQEARRMYQHHVTLDYGLARGIRGFWEKRAGRRLRDGSYLSKAGRMEARLFSLYSRIESKFVRREKVARTFIDPGHKTGSSGNKNSESNPDVMTSVTLGT